jgi:hypothetical protein
MQPSGVPDLLVPVNGNAIRTLTCVTCALPDVEQVVSVQSRLRFCCRPLQV